MGYTVDTKKLPVAPQIAFQSSAFAATREHFQKTEWLLNFASGAMAGQEKSNLGGGQKHQGKKRTPNQFNWIPYHLWVCGCLLQLVQLRAPVPGSLLPNHIKVIRTKPAARTRVWPQHVTHSGPPACVFRCWPGDEVLLGNVLCLGGHWQKWKWLRLKQTPEAQTWRPSTFASGLNVRRLGGHRKWHHSMMRIGPHAGRKCWGQGSVSGEPFCGQLSMSKGAKEAPTASSTSARQPFMKRSTKFWNAPSSSAIHCRSSFLAVAPEAKNTKTPWEHTLLLCIKSKLFCKICK